MRRFSPRSVRARLTALFVVASAAVVLSLSFVLLVAEARQSSRRLERNLISRIDGIELSMRRTNRFPYTETYGEVRDAENNVLFASQAIPLGGLLSADQVDVVLESGDLRFRRDDFNLGGTERVLAQRRTVNGYQVVIAVGVSEEVLRAARRELIVALSLGAPLLVGLVGMLGWALAGAILRPVRRMTDDAAAISKFGASSRLDIGAGSDEITHLGETLNSMLGRLEDAYKRERSFVDDASHELRTPLAVVRGELELAMLHPGNPAATQMALDRGIEEVDRLIALANDLLVSARTNDVGQADPGVRCSVSEAVFRVVGRAARSQSIRILDDVRLDRDVSVALRSDQLDRVLENLLTNARRYAGSQILVSAHLAQHLSLVEVSVTDDGPGFPTDFLDRAFDRFTTADTSRTRGTGGGVGLGLAIVAQLATSAGGTVRASNRVDRSGAVVTVALPMFTNDMQPSTVRADA